MKTYRPSLAGATSAAVVLTAPGANTRWTPLLGERGTASPDPPGSRVTWPAHTPAALTTARATSMVSRASSTWHSKYRNPRDGSPSPGMASATRPALTDVW